MAVSFGWIIVLLISRDQSLVSQVDDARSSAALLERLRTAQIIGAMHRRVRHMICAGTGRHGGCRNTCGHYLGNRAKLRPGARSNAHFESTQEGARARGNCRLPTWRDYVQDGASSSAPSLCIVVDLSACAPKLITCRVALFRC